MDSSQAALADNFVERMTNDEDRKLGTMIKSLALARPSAISRRACPSSLGSLDRLPPEVLVMILDYLDFLSLSRISQTSLLGKDIVEGMAAYRDMMQHAPESLTALGRTGLLSFHSASLLHQTLRSRMCVSCYDSGAFLLLPTCERVCFECVYRNSALRVMRVNDAKAVFGLKEVHLRKIPILRNIPREYGVRYSASQRKRLRLLNVKQVKQLAIRVHGSCEALNRCAPKYPGSDARRKGWMLLALHSAPLEIPGSDMSKLREQKNLSEDEFGGVATIRFPFLSPCGADSGRLCRGCEVTFEHNRYGMLPVKVCKELSAPLSNANESLLAAMSRLRTKDDSLDHINQCYGVKRILAGEENPDSVAS